MLIRILSSIILLPIFLFFIFTGGIFLKILVFLISLLATRELSKALLDKKFYIECINYVFLLIYYLLLDKINYNYFFIIIISYILINLLYVVFFYEKITIIDISLNIFIFFYAVIMMSTIYLIKILQYGNYFVWLIFINAWGSDTFAYFTGKLIGKHKLHKKLSPNKTIEGSLGGILGSLILNFIYYFLFIKNIDYLKNYFVLYLIISVFSPILSQIGDLVASSIKRYTKLRDYGKIIPGHGGILDRFDSIIITSSFIYIVMIFYIN